MPTNQAPHSSKYIKILLIILIGVTLAIAIGGGILAMHWPFSQAKIAQSLQETFPATVTFQKFHSTYFPHPGCVAEGVVFRRLGSIPATPPIVSIQLLTIQAHYIDVLFRPGYLALIIMNGFRVQVPPAGTPLDDTHWRETPSATRVGEIVADGATIEIALENPQPPLRFDIHTLKMSSVSRDKPLSYAVSLHNPLPPGEIRADGQFGPWNSDHPGETPVAGEYTFQNADLGVFRGIAGILSARDKFQGILQHIETHGSIDIPGFMVTRSEHSVHVTADYHAFVNGTNGDVRLERVTAAYLKTSVQAKGEIAGHAGQHGKTASLDLTVRDGRIQDVLRLFVREPKPPLNGVTNFRAQVVIPPDLHPFLHKVRLVADFGIAGGKFAKPSTQAKVDTLSERARGIKPDEDLADEEEDTVISDLAGQVQLRDATATFSNFSFAVPGAFAQMHGTYNLESTVVDLHGTLKTDAEFSKMNSGFKSVLLKPFNIFFQRKHAGAALPVHLIGTYHAPEFGLDFPIKKSADKATSAGN
jgi:hypothetical protein